MAYVFSSEDYVTWLRLQAQLKRPYWYGTYDNLCTDNLLKKKTKQYPSHYTPERMPRYRADIAAEQICGDCVGGAIKGAIWSDLGAHPPVYGSNGCPDRSADGMFEQCKYMGADYGPMSAFPDVPGVVVRQAGHLGVYVGDGQVVEWRGFKTGCVMTRLSQGRWTQWYYLPWVDYGDTVNTYPEQVELGQRLLKRGKKGEDVRTLQETLIKLGYELPRYGADGDYGRETAQAVMEFQRRFMLEVDGEYGPQTHAALMGLLAELDEQESESVPAFARKLEVTGGSVYVRAGAGAQHEILTVVRRGTLLTWLATAENGWHSVQLSDGRTGWISPKYTRVVEV